MTSAFSRSSGSFRSATSQTQASYGVARETDRLEGRWPNLRLIHLPVHASWLNQIEIAFSIIQRKLLQPNQFDSTAQLARALNGFERFYNEIGEPFDWTSQAPTSPSCTPGSPPTTPTLSLAA